MQRYYVILQALRPIAHGDTVTGVDNATNTRLFMRSGANVDGKHARVPDISENALRSVMIRRPLHDHLLRSLDIERGTMPRAVVNLLYAGGDLGAGAREPGDAMALGHALRRLYPSLDLLGGATDTFVLPKSRLSLTCWPVAREFAAALAYVAPADIAQEAAQASVYDMIHEETRTRGTGAEAEGNQMLYTYETMAAGTKLFVECTLDEHAPAATAAALSVALSSWDCFIGGQHRQGRGRMGIVSHTLPERAAYDDHLAQHRDAMRAGLVDGTFGTGKVLCAP